MARPKKPEERNRIRDVAFSVFSNKGFIDTSFSDVAKEASVSKSLVQYYFPKKEQFMADFIDRSMSAVQDIIKSDPDMNFEDPVDLLYAEGYAQFYFALYNDKMLKLAKDILRDRGNTETVVGFAMQWIMNHADIVDWSDENMLEQYRKTFTYVVGGAFDYIYACLSTDEEIDTKFIADTSLLILNPFLPEPFTNGEAIQEKLDAQWLETARKKYNRMIFLNQK